MIRMLMAAGMLFIPCAALAQAPETYSSQEQRYGFNALQRNDLAAAEARLIAQLAEEPDEPSVLLNLAYVYAKTGREDQALQMYDQVLRLPDVQMALGSGKPASSHLLARAGKVRTSDIALRK